MSVIYSALKKVQCKQHQSKNQNLADRRDSNAGFLHGFSLPWLRDFYIYILLPFMLLLGILVLKSSWHVVNPSTLFKHALSFKSGFFKASGESKGFIIAEGRKKIDNNAQSEENHHLIQNQKGIKYFNKKDYAKAISEFEKAISFKSDYAEPYNNLGLVFKTTGDMEKALQYYKKALLLNPDYAEALNNSGVVLIGMGRIETGESRFRKAIEVKPSYADPYLNLAQSLDSSGSEYQALRYYDEFLKKYSGDDVKLIASIKERSLQIRSSSINILN